MCILPMPGQNVSCNIKRLRLIEDKPTVFPLIKSRGGGRVISRVISFDGFMQETNQKIGRLIYQIRQERGLTQSGFAKKLGTSQSAVNRIEHGKQNLSLDTLGRISDVLHKQIISISDNAVNLRIEGGHKLHGEIELKTSKNASVALLCASLLNKGTTRLKRVPK